MRTTDSGDKTWPEVSSAIDAGTGIILPVGATE